MRYTRLSTYDIVKGTFPELTGIVGKGMLPIFNQQPGFVDYGLLDAGNNKVVAISIWTTREAAETSVATAATWIKENVSDRVTLIPIPDDVNVVATYPIAVVNGTQEADLAQGFVEYVLGDGQQTLAEYGFLPPS